MIRKFFPLSVFLCLLLTCCGQRDMPEKSRMGALGKQVMVVSDHFEATKVGVRILEKGGNAMDAAVGVQFALAVVLPYAGNIGGGGFAVIRTGNGGYFSLDFREKAPVAASRELYLDSAGNVIPELSIFSHLACGVPGSVAGMEEMHRKFGKLPWKDILEDAIILARSGFPITEIQAAELNSEREKFLKYNRKTAYVPFLKGGEWKEGDTLRQEDLALALERIRDQGREGFYSGPTAEFLIQEMKKGGGKISQEDLDRYEAIWRDPVLGEYKNYKIITMGPPSSGGIALMQLMGMVDKFPMDKMGRNSAAYIHLLAEAERRVYADRALHLGDMDFYDVPVAELLDTGYLRQRMLDFNPDKATISDSVFAGEFDSDSSETTHFSVVDGEGNAVSITTTINTGYGSRIVVEGCGFLLNNEMDDFSLKPGEPNSYGLIGADANSIEPGKRMLSSMTPTIIEKNGELFMVAGTPGGSTIITSVFQAILNVIEHEATMHEAVNFKRFHHQWKPDQITCEEGTFTPQVLAKLQKKGHEVKVRNPIGSMNCILFWPGGWIEGGDDGRRDNWPMGF